MVFLFRWSWRYVLVATLECPENPLLLSWWFSFFAKRRKLVMRSLLLGFGPGGTHLTPIFHLTLIRFRAWGVPISRNLHLTI